MSFVTSWFNVLLPKIRPLLYVNGGPIISVQVITTHNNILVISIDLIYTNILSLWLWQSVETTRKLNSSPSHMMPWLRLVQPTLYFLNMDSTNDRKH